MINFFIRSSSVDLDKYTIKDIPGSSGRLDVISRCILSALAGDHEFLPNRRIWTFLDEYGTYIFDSRELNFNEFPKNELKLTDSFVTLIKEPNKKNPLRHVRKSDMIVYDTLEKYKQNSKIFILHERGENFMNLLEYFQAQENLVFVIGNQSGKLVESPKLKDMGFPFTSLGTKSYLASSTIRLINLLI
jgi:tRNA (pseudouridine54-N1)-methyltransferase